MPTIGFIDLRNRVLHDGLVLPVGAAGLMTAWVIESTSVRYAGLELVAGSAMFLLIRSGYRPALGREEVGLGDVKLGGALGAWVVAAPGRRPMDGRIASFTYDEPRAGFYNVGQLTIAANPYATIQTRYDDEGRLESHLRCRRAVLQ